MARPKKKTTTSSRTAPSPSAQALTIRLGDLKPRLTEAAAQLRLSENDIGRAAIEALLDAVEKNNYRILWPPKMMIEGDRRSYKA